MDARPSPGLISRAEGRRFAWTLAAGFLVLAAIAAWRGHARSAIMLSLVGAVALAAGALVPSRLGPIQRGWTALGEGLSRLTSPLFFGAMYLLIVTPAGFLRRTIGRSPLDRSRDAASFWMRRTARTPEEERASLEHLF